LVNAVLLLSGGQAVRTPQLEPIEDLENALKNFSNALKWDPRKSHLLLSQLGFVNDGDVQSRRHCSITLERVGTMVYPFGFLLVAPLVISGIETMIMMSKKKVAKSSYINPHGDLSWATFGENDIDIKD
jgi:hypothetical protein